MFGIKMRIRLNENIVKILLISFKIFFLKIKNIEEITIIRKIINNATVKYSKLNCKSFVRNDLIFPNTMKFMNNMDETTADF
tara:strand:- start:1031 stop:1276 length:246 start_codon:yes stop_codon:yes gene_type:complete